VRSIRNFNWVMLAGIAFCLAFWGLAVMILRGLFA